MNLFHRLAAGGALSLAAASALGAAMTAPGPQPVGIAAAEPRSAEGPAVVAQYWFDQSADRHAFTPGSFTIDTGSLPDGLHTLHAQVSEDGVPTWTETALFIKTFNPGPDVACSYWFDQQEERHAFTPGTSMIEVARLPAGLHTIHAVVSAGGMPTWAETAWFLKTVSLAPGQTYTTNVYVDGTLYTTLSTPIGESGMLSLSVDTDGLPLGMHLIEAQVISPDGIPTALSQAAFMRVPTTVQLNSAKLYYLIDGIPAGELTPTYTEDVYKLDIDVASLTSGLHSITSYIAGADGFASNVETAWFVKIPTGGEGVKSYAYWLNDNPSTMREVTLDKPANPFELVALLDMPQEPFCSRRYQFVLEDGKPVVYGQNDYQIRFRDLDGRFTLGSGRYTDVRVRQAVTPAGVLTGNASTKVEGLSENEVRFYTFSGQAGDSIAIRLDAEAMWELYSPAADTLIALSGAESVKRTPMTLTENGVYYLAVHDIQSGSGNSVDIEFEYFSTSSIEDLEADGIEADREYYDLQGHRVDPAHLPKGTVVVSRGMKFIVR